jgi:hypothetical protein
MGRHLLRSPWGQSQASDNLRDFLLKLPRTEHRPEAAIFRTGNPQPRKSLENFLLGNDPFQCFAKDEFRELLVTSQGLGWHSTSTETA